MLIASLIGAILPPSLKAYDGQTSPSGDGLPTSDSILESARRCVRDADYSGALAFLSEGAELEPSQLADVLELKGFVLLMSGRFKEAARATERAIDLGADSVSIWRRLSWIQRYNHDMRGARVSIERAVALEPDAFDPRIDAGQAARACSDPEAALVHFEHACRLRPDAVTALAGRGASLIEMGDAPAGFEAARNALTRHPDAFELLEVLSIACNKLGRAEEARGALQRASAIYRELRAAAPREVGSSKVVMNFATQVMELGQHEEALRIAADELRLNPDGETQFFAALRLITMGHHGEGWRRYLSRWQVGERRGRRPCPEVPRWTGQALTGRSIMIGEEQGIGDVIQFSRFALALKERGAKVVLGVGPELRSLAESFMGVDKVVVAGEPLPDVDYFQTMAGLPAWLGAPDALGTPFPYVRVDPEKHAHWRRRFAELRGPKVGLVWAGNPNHVRDADRSMSFAELEPVLSIDGVSFLSFQKGPRARMLDASSLRSRVLDLGDELRDFTDTMAALANIDVLVTVDTSVAHAAGALGVPVLMLVSEPAEYRWGLDSDITPWYPSMRLVRQTRYRDWRDPIEHVRSLLSRWTTEMIAGRGITLPARRVDAPAPPDVDLRGVPSVVEGRDGVFHLPADEDDAGRSLRHYGEFLPRFRSLAVQLVAPAACVLESQAGIGSTSLALARRIGADGHLWCSESDARRAGFLSNNLFCNRHVNVSVLREAYADYADSWSVDRLQLERLDLWVIHDDVDLARALAGAERSLWSHRPTLCVQRREDGSAEASLPDLQTFGYRCWTGLVPLHDPDNFNRTDVDIFPGLNRVVLLAIPEERDAHISLPGLVEA